MSLSPIPRQEIAGDIANLDNIAVVPPKFVLGDRKYWQAMAEREAESAEGNEVALHMYHVAEENVALASLAAIQAGVTHDGEIIHNATPELASLIKNVAAKNAMGLLIRHFAEADSEFNYNAGDEEYNATPEELFLMDYDAVDHQAHGLIVSKNKLTVTPFTDDVPELTHGEAWYSDGNGLYVAARSPATLSPPMQDMLTLATGSRQNAEDMLSAHEAVTLNPYLSLRSMAE